MPDYRVPVTVTFDLDVPVVYGQGDFDRYASLIAKKITREALREHFSRAVCVSIDTGIPRAL